MQKGTKLLSFLYRLTLPAVAVATVVLRTVAMLTEYETEIGFYKDATLAIVTAVLLVTTAALLAVTVYDRRDFFRFTVEYHELSTHFSGSFLGISLIFFAVTLLIDVASRTGLPLCFGILTAFFALLGCPLFLLRSFGGKALGSAKALLTVALSYFSFFFTVYLCFEGTMMLACPPKLLAIATWSLVTFFFLGEARIALGRPKWPLHTYITVLTAVFTAALSIPNLIYHAVRLEPVLENTVHDFVVFALFLYTSARLFAAFSSLARSATPEIRAITEFREGTSETAADASENEAAAPSPEVNEDEEASDR